MMFLKVLSYACLFAAGCICYICFFGIGGLSRAELIVCVAGWGVILAVLVVIHSNVVLYWIKKIKKSKEERT